MIETLKGFYHLCRENRRITIPTTRRGWTTLISVANAWSEGVPFPLTFGSNLVIDEYQYKPDQTLTLRKHAQEVLEYQMSATAHALAVYGFVPSGSIEFLELVGTFDLCRTIGCKQTFNWRP